MFSNPKTYEKYIFGSFLYFWMEVCKLFQHLIWQTEFTVSF